MNRTIILKGREIKYELVRKKVKNVNLRIRSDGSVFVSANDLVSMETIEKFLLDKASQITRALDKYSEIAKYTVKNFDYVTGESFRFLGRELRFVVVQGSNFVHTDGVYLSLHVNDASDFALKRKLVNEWLDEQCKAVLTEIADDVYQTFKKYGISKPSLVLKDMTSRWGSCQPKRATITLNKRLIEVPRSAMQYVVVHEFIHFLHPNHSKGFYEALATIMPDWKEQKKLLEITAFYVP